MGDKQAKRIDKEAFMIIVEHERDGYLISTDSNRLDYSLIHDYLAGSSYWARNRTYEVVKKSILNSLCFGIYTEGQQIGFARMVTDYATFGWLCDVFILDMYRGKGLGKWLVECVVNHPELKEVKRILLATSDAHELYHTYGGFQSLQAPERWMERLNR
jgi:GNAT superfamily N-acetyltransferase